MLCVMRTFGMCITLRPSLMGAVFLSASKIDPNRRLPYCCRPTPAAGRGFLGGSMELALKLAGDAALTLAAAYVLASVIRGWRRSS